MNIPELEIKIWLAVLVEQGMYNILYYTPLFWWRVMYCLAYRIRELPQLMQKANMSLFFFYANLSLGVPSAIKSGNKWELDE